VHDTPPDKFDPRWLDGATHRSLAHWMVTLGLDPELLRKNDRFRDWCTRCGMDLREMDEGGVVIRRPNESFFYITTDQVNQLNSEIEVCFKAGEA